MKKTLINLALAALLGFGAVTISGCGKEKGCTDERADNFDSAAEEDDDSCDETATVGKFAGIWKFGNVYEINITRSGEYRVSVTSDFGFNGVNPTSVNGSVSQSTITIPNQSLYQGNISGTITYVNASQITFVYTLSGFGASGGDGSYTDVLTR